MAETITSEGKVISSVAIKESSGIVKGQFAVDVDNLMAYENGNATPHSVQDLLFGGTNPESFINQSMWGQLDAKAKECVKILNDNSPFWEGLSNEQYKEGEEINLKYRATENDINALNFYGDDAIKDPEDLLDTPKPYPKDKLISLGALEDFAKRIPTMGGNHNIGKNQIALGEEAVAKGNYGFAVNAEATGEKSIAINSNISKGIYTISMGSGAEAINDNTIAIGRGALAYDKEWQTVIGPFNAYDKEADFMVGIGRSNSERKNGLIIKNGSLWAPVELRGNLEPQKASEPFLASLQNGQYEVPIGTFGGSLIIGYPDPKSTNILPITYNFVRGEPKTEIIEIGFAEDLAEGHTGYGYLYCKIVYTGGISFKITCKNFSKASDEVVKVFPPSIEDFDKKTDEYLVSNLNVYGTKLQIVNFFYN